MSKNRNKIHAELWPKWHANVFIPKLSHGKSCEKLPALSGMAPGTGAPTAHVNLNRWLNIPLHCLPTHEHTLQECPSNTFFQKPSIPNTLWKTERERTWTLAEPWSDHPPPPAPKHIHHPHTAEYGTSAAQTIFFYSSAVGLLRLPVSQIKKYIYIHTYIRIHIYIYTYTYSWLHWARTTLGDIK